MNLRILRHDYRVARAIYPDTCCPCTGGHDIGILCYRVVRAIDMQANPQGHGTVCIIKISRACRIALEKPLIVYNISAVAIN